MNTNQLSQSPQNEQSAQQYQSYQSNNDPKYEKATTPPQNEIDRLQNILDGKYTILKKISQGGQGVVFLARSCQTGQLVAVKQLKIDSVSNWKQYELFEREAQVLKSLNEPGIAKFYDAIEILEGSSPMAVIIQEYIEGDSLQSFIFKGHRFRFEQICDIILQLLDILHSIHSKNPPIIHRDIKPANIILHYDGDSSEAKVYLVDFGAVANPQVQSGGSTVVGTYGYMSPEQLMGHATVKSDIYSLAIIAVYLMSGVPPEELEIHDFHVLIDPHLEHLPHEVTALLRLMLEPKQEQRLCDYECLKKAFQAMKNQQFSEISMIVGKALGGADEKYELIEVHSFHQAGNIELWQSLEDQTPRLKLPDKVEDWIVANTLKDFDGTRIKRAINIFNFKITKFVIALIIIFIVVCFCAGQPVIGLMLIGFLILAIVFARRFFRNNTTLNGNQTLDATTDSEEQTKKDKDAASKALLDIKDFFKTARKTLATVVSIEYDPLTPTLVNDTRNLLNEIPNTTDEDDKWLNLVVHKAPQWIITYAFNPPDDLNPDPLFHKVSCPNKPDIEEGTLIPILYKIYNQHIVNEFVMSTPYPLPYAEISFENTTLNAFIQKYLT